MNANQKKAALMIDQTLLKPDVTKEEVEAFCLLAAKYGFASVCINPAYVTLAHEILKGTKTKTCTVIDFPLGAGGLTSKAYGASAAIAAGADEIDVVADIGLLKAHQFRSFRTQLAHIKRTVARSSAHRPDSEKRDGVLLKVILETCCLTDEEIVAACNECVRVGVDFVKTSTGFASGGATVHAVKLMRQTVGEACGVKASGGIRTVADFKAMVAAGANRIGTSQGVKIIDELAKE